MFDILRKYSLKGHFFFKPTDNFATVCDAPADKAGVYLVYSLSKGRIELVYIGRSGRIAKDGTVSIRKAGIGGIKDRLINGKRDGILMRTFWLQEMIRQDIEALDIYWYVTIDEKYNDNPTEVKEAVLDIYWEIYGEGPRWNRV